MFQNKLDYLYKLWGLDNSPYSRQEIGKLKKKKKGQIFYLPKQKFFNFDIKMPQTKEELKKYL